MRVEFLNGAEPLTDCDFAGGPLCDDCSDEAHRTHINNEANTAALGTAAFTVDSSSEEGDFIRPRTPGTIGLS